MENASEALMMAFGVLIFVLALTVAMNSFSQVKSVSDVVLYSTDATNYYDYEGPTGKASQNREVGLETIIPTLYKYYKENYTVLFRQGKYDEVSGEFSDTKPLTIYETPSKYTTTRRGLTHYIWGKEDSSKDQSTYDTLMQNKYSKYFSSGYTEKGNHSIFSFDLEEETLRHEPWTGTYEKSKDNLDQFLKGKVYYNPNDNLEYIDYKDYGFIKKYNGQTFIETVGEYSYATTLVDGSEDADNYELQFNIVFKEDK